MKISTASCLLPLALVANAAPSVRKAAYTLFDNVNCLRDSSYSRYVFDSEVNECWNFAEASISVDLRELAEGCQLKVHQYKNCGGFPEPVTETECYTSDYVVRSASVVC